MGMTGRGFLCVGLLVGAGFGAAPERTVPVCLSLSPLRALPALGKDLPGPEAARDQLLGALRSRHDTGWMDRAAGECPDQMAVLDVFQLPTDLVNSGDGPVLRFRLEWHHQAGPTEFFVPCPARALPNASLLAAQLRLVASQMLARVELRSYPEPVDLEVLSLGPLPLNTPLVLKTPPGVLSVGFRSGGIQRRKDTLVSTGGLYEIRADFRSARIDPEVGPTLRRTTWPWWATTLVAASATGFFQWRQVQAQRAYSRLGPSDSPARFDENWSDLRQANLLRNGGIGLTLVLAAGSSWWEWGAGR